jgi:serine protease
MRCGEGWIAHKKNSRYYLQLYHISPTDYCKLQLHTLTMKLLFSRGTFTLSLAFAASASAAIDADAVSAADVEGRPLNGRGRDDMNMNMPSFEHYDSGSIKTLLVSYRDEAAHGNVVAHTTAMESQGRAIKESSNIVFSKPHKISGKAGKARRARGLQDDQADDFAKGISFVKVDTTSENYEAEVAALKNIEGVSSVEEDSLVHIYSNFKEHQQNLRGVKAADHISEIQDAMKAATDALPVPEDKIDYSPSHEGRGRRLAEDVPCGINMVNASWVWDQDQPAAMADPIKICVVDTGYDSGHPDLPTEDEHNVKGWHEGIGTDDSPYGEWNIDGHGHGTHCAGTIGAIGGNDIGVTSVNPDPSKFQFIIGKGLDDRGRGYTSNLLEAVEKCVEMGAKVVSMSLGGGGHSWAVNGVYEDIYDQGVLIIAAAGNSGNSAYSYPASYPVVMSVGSVTSTRSHNGFSQYNDQVEIAAPGTAVLSTVPDNKYASYSGTSMATSHVAGVAALLWSHFPDCTNNQIRNAMIQSAADPPTDSDGWNSEYGWGIVNAGHAYELLKTGCETAGGVGTPLYGTGLSDIAHGGKDQKIKGCTLDAHCDQSNFCHTGTSKCIGPPTSKYVCEKHTPFDSVICAKGVEQDDKCSRQGQSCGNSGSGKKCRFAECADEEATD